MGTLTNTQLQDEVRANLGNRTDLDTRLERLLNLAQTRMVRAHQFEEFQYKDSVTYPFANTDADAEFTLPANVWKVWSLTLLKSAAGAKLADARRLTYVRPRSWDERITNQEFFSRGKPSFYTRYGGEDGSVEIFPMASEAYTGEIRGLKRPTALSTPSQTADFVEKDDLLITLTTVICWDSLGKEDRALKMWRRYRSMLSEAISDDETQPDSDIKPTFENLGRSPVGQYWTDPFMRTNP